MVEHDFGGLITGSIFILIGVGWIMGNVYGFSFWNLVGTYWPVIFIFIGLSILVKHYRKD